MASEPVNRESNSVILTDMFSRYDKWVEAINLATKAQSFSISVPDQKPEILWIGCSDSRVLEAEITDSGPGHIFVHRNIANQFHLDDDNAMSVLTYGIENLEVRRVCLVGHTHCGGVKACYQREEKAPLEPGTAPEDGPLQRWLAPLMELGRKTRGESETALVEANVRMQVENLQKCEVIQRKWEGLTDISIYGLVYELETGRLRDLGITVGKFGKFED
ncbi:hypothetical protein V8D89_003459 [Ganoderma adspersum]